MTTAFLMITTTPGKEREVLKQLMSVNEIKEAHAVYGDYDLIAKVDVGKLENLQQIVLSKIGSMAEISTSTTLIAL